MTESPLGKMSNKQKVVIALVALFSLAYQAFYAEYLKQMHIATLQALAVFTDLVFIAIMIYLFLYFWYSFAYRKK
ncbi:MAG: hypothetical protein QXG05_06515 [Nitrososphaerota archaeon]